MGEPRRSLGPPTPLASFDVRAFARASERIYASAAAFAEEERPTRRQAALDAPVAYPPPAATMEESVSADDWISLDDGTSLDVARIPSLVSARGELGWTDLGDAAVHLVLRIDGETSVRALIAESRMAPGKVAIALGDLVARGIVVFR